MAVHSNKFVVVLIALTLVGMTGCTSSSPDAAATPISRGEPPAGGGAMSGPEAGNGQRAAQMMDQARKQTRQK